MRKTTAALSALALLVGCATQAPPHATSPASSGTSPALSPTPAAALTITPSRLDVHDGQLLYWLGMYYLIGTAYSNQDGCFYAWGISPTQWCGFHAYMSSDLQNWIDEGPLFDPAPWQGRCGTGNLGCFRPHEVYNAADRQWVLWANVDDTPTHPQSSGVEAWTGPTPIGPFVDAGQPRLSVALGRPHYGDLSVFVDADGTGYATYTVISGAVHDLAVEKLDQHYLNGTGEAVHLPRAGGFDLVEAPSLFRSDATYHLIFSDPICAYCRATGTGWATAPSPLGPWTKQADLSATSCNGQPSFVSVLPGLILYQSDLWLGTPNESPALQHWEPLSVVGSTLSPLTCQASFTWPMAE